MTQEEIKAVNDAISFVAMAISEPRRDAIEHFNRNEALRLPKEVSEHIRTILSLSQTHKSAKGADFDIDLRR